MLYMHGPSLGIPYPAWYLKAPCFTSSSRFVSGIPPREVEHSHATGDRVAKLKLAKGWSNCSLSSLNWSQNKRLKCWSHLCIKFEEKLKDAAIASCLLNWKGGKYYLIEKYWKSKYIVIPISTPFFEAQEIILYFLVSTPQHLNVPLLG